MPSYPANTRMLSFRLVALLLCLTCFQPASADTPAESATLKLNSDMMMLYNGALKDAQSDLLREHPVILALFTGQGGKMMLYRPGQPPLVADRVPIGYELMKSVGHSSMAVFAHAYANRDHSEADWRAAMAAYRATNQQALDQLSGLDMPADWRETMGVVIQRNIRFMDQSLSQGKISESELQAFATEQKPALQKLIAWSAETQVAHWMQVLEGWKALLGPDWEKTYGCSNTLYVTRQNNILFQVLAQYFGKSAFNSRLFLFETSAFTTEPDQMLGLLARIVGDRQVGDAFFGNLYLMDYELMGGDAHRAIESESKKRGMTPVLPPLVPFQSSEWPMHHDPSQGVGPGRLEDVKKAP